MYVLSFAINVRGLLAFYFFFSSRRRHTRFDCDWSSDVCSSDLPGPLKRDVDAAYVRLLEGSLSGPGYTAIATHDERLIEHAIAFASREGVERRSEERRVGKECRSRWSPYH